MILELVSFLGTSVGGTALGHIGRMIQGRSEAAAEKREHDHQQRLADKKQLAAFIKATHEPQGDGSYSPFSYAITFILCLLGTTYCAATVSLFLIDPNDIMLTKDPTSDSRSLGIFWGLLHWDLQNNKILSMSRAGCGFLMCYPIIFILSMVVTGEKPKRTR
jgi:hypothetical protein